MKTIKIKAILMALIFALGFTTTSIAQELSGTEIIKKVYERRKALCFSYPLPMLRILRL